MERAAEYSALASAHGRNGKRRVEKCNAGRAGAHRPSEALHPTRSSDVLPRIARERVPTVPPAASHQPLATDFASRWHRCPSNSRSQPQTNDGPADIKPANFTKAHQLVIGSIVDHPRGHGCSRSCGKLCNGRVDAHKAAPMFGLYAAGDHCHSRNKPACH